MRRNRKARARTQYAGELLWITINPFDQHPYVLGFAAALLFTALEALTPQIMKCMSAELYLLARNLLALPVLLTLARRIPNVEQQAREMTYHPLKISWRLWARGILANMCTVSISMGLGHAENQTAVYAWFMLHPVFATGLVWVLSGQKPDFRRQLFPMALTVLGAVLFSYLKVNNATVSGAEATTQTAWSDVFYGIICPASAGLFFAAGNVVVLNAKVTLEMNAAAVSVYTAYTALLSSVLMCPLLWVLKEQWPCVQWGGIIGLAGIALLASGCIGAVASILITHAFGTAKPEQVGILSLMDLAAIPISAIFAVVAGQLPVSGPNGLCSLRGVTLLLIMVGAWLGIRAQD